MYIMSSHKNADLNKCIRSAVFYLQRNYFLQIGSRSSVYSPESRVRKTGSFIYEDFMPTDGTDVKVSCVNLLVSLISWVCVVFEVLKVF